VAGNIRDNATKVAINEERIVNNILSHQDNDTFSYRTAYESELATHNKQLDKLDALIESLYEDKVSGVVPESLFKRQIVKYEQERKERSQAVRDLEKRLMAVKPIADNTSAWIELMKQYSDIDALTLDAETLIALIDKIIIGEPQFISGRRVCDVKIVYNYVGCVDELEDVVNL
jgi:hypothetical protein